MKLIHNFRYNCDDWELILENVSTIRQLVKNIVKYATAYANRYPHVKDEKYRVYSGDAFETFVEAFIKSHGASSEVGITQYEPLRRTGSRDEDTGVDGTGVGSDLKIATVQCKFKSNPTCILTANDDHLTNFTSTSWGEYKVDTDSTTNMLIVSTGKDLAHHTRAKMLQGKVRFIGIDQLSVMLDNNYAFWEEFRAATMPIVSGDNC